MAEYHVGCGLTGIFAGTLNKNKDRWTNKSDVTHEAVCAVAQYLLEENKCMKFDFGGKRYKIHVEEE